MDIKKIIVHNGKFHADDVFCVAMTLICNPDAEVERVSTVTKNDFLNEGTFIVDIGYGKYDHHQPDAERRKDGSLYASCGLLFRDLKHKLFNGDHGAADEFEMKYIIPIEIADNGGKTNPLSDAISAFNPSWDSDEELDEAFIKAVEFAKGIIKREVIQQRSERRAVKMVRSALEESDGKTVVLKEYMPWRNVLVPSSAIFVIYPSNREGYNLQTVPKGKDTRESKRALPNEWICLKPKGCNFVHPALFIAGFESAESAMVAAEHIV